MSRPPRTLRIGPYTFTLRVDDAAIIDEVGTGVDSIAAFTNLAALTMTFATKANQPAAVVHEILHVLSDQSGLNIRLGQEREEDVVQSLEHGLLAVIRANPALIAYLTE